MRIGFISYGLDRGLTGIGRYLTQLMQALQNQIPQIKLVLLATEHSDPYNLWSQYETHHLQFCHSAPGLLLWGNVAIADAIKRYKLDMVHDPNGIAPFFIPAGRAKRVVTVHDTFGCIHPESHNHFDNWRYRWILPQALQQADRVLTDSENSRKDIMRFLAVTETKIKVVACAVDKRFKMVEDSAERQATLNRYNIRGPYLLYIGGINARKNIARLLEAYARIRVGFPEVSLVIGGKRQWRLQEIDQTLQRLRLEEIVKFTGYVQEADLPALYSAATAFVFPSLYEGFGLPPLEAMACGTPVVCSNVSSLPEVVGEAALTINPYSVEDLTKALEQILSDFNLRAELRHKGLARANLYNWERAAKETFQVYQEIL